MFCECRQTQSGDLDCNYTSPFDTRFSTTPKIESSTQMRTTLIDSTIKYQTESEETSQTPTDLPSVYTSTITQSVPMTSRDGSYTPSTIEVLDLSTVTDASTSSPGGFTHESSKPGLSSDLTEQLSSSTTSLGEFSSEATTLSSETSSSFSSMLTTRSTISRTTSKLRPCPPDAVRPTTMATSTSTKAFEVTSEKSSSESSSTFPVESSSTSTQFASSTESSLPTITDETNEISSQSASTPKTTQPDDEITIPEQLETSEAATTLGTFETSSKSSDISPSSEKPTQSTLATKEESVTTDISIENVTNVVESHPSSSSFQPPTTTEDLFTLKPTDVSNVTDTDCKTLKCYNGGTCMVTSEGPKCVCRFDRQDPNCRSLIRIKNAAFAGDSYLSHLMYSDNHKDFDIKPLDSILPINIELRARTRASDGLILLAIAQGTQGGHYTALFLHNGLLQFQFSCGLQTMLLSELEAPINTGNEFTIHVALDFSRNHSHCNASLRINDTLAMSGDQPTWLGLKTPGKSKTINSVWLHLGGSPQTPVVLMSELPGGQGFTGCLHSLRVNEVWKEIFRFVI